MNEHQKISRKGGSSGRGADKARTSEQARAAAQARWSRHDQYARMLDALTHIAKSCSDQWAKEIAESAMPNVNDEGGPETPQSKQSKP